MYTARNNSSILSLEQRQGSKPQFELEPIEFGDFTGHLSRRDLPGKKT